MMDAVLVDAGQGRVGVTFSDGFLRALGRVTVNFGNLELYVALALWALLETDSATSTTITADLSFKARVNLLNDLALAKLANDPLLASVERRPVRRRRR